MIFQIWIIIPVCIHNVSDNHSGFYFMSISLNYKYFLCHFNLFSWIIGLYWFFIEIWLFIGKHWAISIDMIYWTFFNLEIMWMFRFIFTHLIEEIIWIKLLLWLKCFLCLIVLGLLDRTSLWCFFLFLYWIWIVIGTFLFILSKIILIKMI